MPGLTNGQRYAFAVRAVNAAGAGPATTVIAAPATTPGAPQRLSGAPGDDRVTLGWEAPASDGGSAILRYEYARSTRAGPGLTRASIWRKPCRA